MRVSQRVSHAVRYVLNLAPLHGEVSLLRLVDAVSKDRERPIDVVMAPLPLGVCGQWRQYSDRDVFLIEETLPVRDRTLAHELGHLVLDHQGVSVVEAAREQTRIVSTDLISYMLNERGGCMGPNGEEAELEAEDFARLLVYRLGRLASDRSSIVQVRLGEAFA